MVKKKIDDKEGEEKENVLKEKSGENAAAGVKLRSRLEDKEFGGRHKKRV